jgi:UPF0176 protein
MDDTYQNIYDKETLKKRLEGEDFSRKTVSFYRYVILDDVEALRDELYVRWAEFGILGRIYIAREGINAQISVPEHHWDSFVEDLNGDTRFSEMTFKVAVEDFESFYKLMIKVREKIVADGLSDDAYDVTDVGTHLDPETFHELVSDENTVCVDMRNHYESEIGHFKGAVCPDADTFSDELPMVRDMLKEHEGKKVLLYCTGGIRCEKASAYLKSEGFPDVNQLHGGIIAYAHWARTNYVKPKFIGKNFVFDARIGERISDEVISDCHQCGESCDTHTNCKNDDCHLLFIQCVACSEKMAGCCTPRCQEIAALPIEKQRALRKGCVKDGDCRAVYKSRLRPKLSELIQT